MQRSYVSINSDLLLTTIKSSKYNTIGNLALALNIHRNTISDYLRQKTPVVLPTFEQILKALKLEAEDIFITNKDTSDNIAEISDLVEQLSISMPEAAFYLFGSRSRQDAKTFSDYDLGVFKKNGLTGKDFSKLHMKVIDWNESSMTTVQIVNLNNADKNFLKVIKKDLIFLAGSYASRNEVSRII